MYYDLTVPGHGHYVADGFIHHNTGKTLGSLWKLHVCACLHPNASIVIMRKTAKSAQDTVVQTFKRKVLAMQPGINVIPYGGEQYPSRFIYPNKATISITGMDKASKVLSGEHDIIFACQAEEFSLAEWETLTTRTTGRAGNMPFAQTIGDVNPAYPGHWMYHRSTLRMFYSKHQENPALFDPVTGEITKQGERTMRVLEALTGVRRKRLLLGLPAMAEGAIYGDDWDDSIHLIYEEELPRLVRYAGAQDWGYTNPGVFGLFGFDYDDRAYLIAQIYQTRKTIDWWAKRVKKLHEAFGLEWVVCDSSEPAYIDRYRREGIPAEGAFMRVRPGIDAVKERLTVKKDDPKGLPRFFIVRDSLIAADPFLVDEKKPIKVEDEIAGYVWSNSKRQEEPIKENDHGLDMSRYFVAKADNVGTKPKKKVRSMR